MANGIQHAILAVTGGIAAYKAADLCSKLVHAGTHVRVAFSQSASQFITPLTFEALTGHPVYQHVFNTPTSHQMEHISWARWAHALIIAPATADIIAKLAHGQADDPVTTLYLAFTGPVYLAPSMNTTMLQHPATQANLLLLSQRGVNIVTPGTGALACGETGSGRMAEPNDILVALGLTPPQPEKPAAPTHTPDTTPLTRPPDTSLAGATVLITSGPTREYLDPVRYISSPSSGRMGHALAREALRRGAHVHYITGPVAPHLIPTGNTTIHPIQTARELLQKVQELKDQTNIFIFAAAVADFRPANPINQKIKRTGNSITLPLTENPDIAQAIGFSKQPNQYTIGFAAETHDLEANAHAKLQRKNLNMIILNDVSNPDIGFNSPNNEIHIITPGNSPQHIPKTTKENIAYEILHAAIEDLHQHQN